MKKAAVLLLMFAFLLAGCGAPTPIEQACIGAAELPPFDRVTVEGYLLQRWCNQAAEGEIMCQMIVESGGQSIDAVMKTRPNEPFPAGLYPRLEPPAIWPLVCSGLEDCQTGRGMTLFRVEGECATLLARSMGWERGLYVDFNDIRPAGSSGLQPWLVVPLVVLAGGGAAGIFLYRKGKSRPDQGPSSVDEDVARESTVDEIKMLELLSKGLDNDEIAWQLGITPGESRLITSRLEKQFDAATPGELVAKARERGNLPPL
jgi:DNA-binding CsgD family transcriptional regulator